MDDSQLLSRLRARRPRTDMPPLRGLPGVLSAGQVVETTRTLGFAPPDLLVRMFRTIGNGGFGPGYGFMGLAGGSGDDRRRTSVEVYHWLREEDDGEDLLPGEEPCPPMIPEGMLPIAYLGCCIYFCVDCQAGDEQIWLFDGDADDNQLQPFGMDLRQWLHDWEGGDTFWR